MSHRWNDLWHFTPQAFIPLSGLLCTMALGLFVWRKKGRAPVSRAFVALNAAAALWNLDVLLLFTVRDEGLAGALDRIFQLPILSIPLLALIFVLVFLDRKTSHPLALLFGLWTAFLWWLSPGDNFIRTWERHWYGFYGLAGRLYLLFPLTHLAYLVLSCALLWKERRSTRDPVRHAQAGWVLAANAVFGLVSLDNFLPLYGSDRLPLGNLSAVLYFCIIAFTIVRHRLLDIRVIFRYGIIYSTLTFLLSGLYLLLVLALQGWARIELFRGSFLLSSLPVLAVAFAFVPLKNSLQEILDRRFYRTRTLMRSRLAEFPEVLARIESEKEVWQAAWEGGWSLVGPRRAKILVERNGVAAPALAPGNLPRGGGEEETEVEVPVEGRSGRLGLCLLGGRRDGGVYGVEEISFLRGIAGQTALAIERVRLAEEGRRKERLADLGRAAAFISHEIRGPLNVIRGTMALLRSRVRDGDGEDLVRLVEEEVRRGGRVIEDFLSAVREPRPLMHPLDLSDLLGDLAGEGGREAAGGVSVRLRAPAGGVWVMGDHIQLRRLFDNLVRNSAESTGSGGHVAVECASSGGAVTVTVADDGPGIAEEILPRLFEPFQTTKRGGTGLGLAIAKAIVDAHGGRIGAENAPGRGALFRVLLPEAPRPDGAAEGEKERRVATR